jgi:hypothetical protein
MLVEEAICLLMQLASSYTLWQVDPIAALALAHM